MEGPGGFRGASRLQEGFGDPWWGSEGQAESAAGNMGAGGVCRGVLGSRRVWWD